MGKEKDSITFTEKKSTMKKITLLLATYCISANIFAQAPVQSSTTTPSTPPATTNSNQIKDLKFNLSDDGSRWLQFTALNQTWLRYNENNDGTLVDGKPEANTFDIGLRRTRFQIFGQVTDRVFVYFQLGQNNFNAQANYNAAGSLNRKNTFFIHDAYSEYQVFKDKKWLKLGGGLTIANGLSRFSQPSIGTIATMDVPVFAQATVDQTDQFSRKLSAVARGQIGKVDYRFSLSNPFPIQSNGSTPAAAPGTSATFSQYGHNLQYQTYIMYQFFEHEGHNTPYMTGAYLGKKKVFNIAGGYIFQKNAMWKQGNTPKDTTYQDMNLWCIESFLDMPLNTEKGTAINAYVGYFNTNFGTNYLRYNGIMNPATGSNATNLISKSAYGNALPMFGTGQVIYAQVAYLLPKDLLGENHGALMPYISNTYAKYDALGNNNVNTLNAGLNWLINNHKAKLTLDYQNRPTYTKDVNGNAQSGTRKGCFTLQYQIFI
ncbi:MAG: hypothetical protein RLZZ175_1905 [Bacteroidota bacterium]|jgi:hypothetical protein